MAGAWCLFVVGGGGETRSRILGGANLISISVHLGLLLGVADLEKAGGGGNERGDKKIVGREVKLRAERAKKKLTPPPPLLVYCGGIRGPWPNKL